MLTATLRLFSEESGSSDYSPKTGQTIAEIWRSGQYNGESSHKARATRRGVLLRAPAVSVGASLAARCKPRIKSTFTTEVTELTEKRGFYSVTSVVNLPLTMLVYRAASDAPTGEQ